MVGGSVIVGRRWHHCNFRLGGVGQHAGKARQGRQSGVGGWMDGVGGWMVWVDDVDGWMVWVGGMSRWCGRVV